MISKNIVNDVSKLNEIEVKKVIRPKTIEELCHIIKHHNGDISIGGGRFSMGGQIATENSLHIDMRSLNKIISFNPSKRCIHVQAGIRWRDIQEEIDKSNLAIKIMQTYSNFTLGGSMSVNSHGRYIGQGPLILSINSFNLVLANGEIIEASPSVNPEIYYGAIGGYGGLGVISDVSIELVPNTKIRRIQAKINISEYKKYFFDNIRNNINSVFHNTDIYPPHYNKARSITWVNTEKPLTAEYRVTKNKQSYALERYFVWAITSTPIGKWRREYIIDPLIYFFNPVIWRNYEAGSYDVAELEPRSRKRNTYILQEYFIPVEKFDIFMALMKEILQRFQVNIFNISIRHSKKDPGSVLAWAREEVFAFVIYYKQKVTDLAKNKVAIWTRELIDAAISVEGTYYLPYQIHATTKQFHQAYPRAHEFFMLKNRLDSKNKFKNKLWDKYYPLNQQKDVTNDTKSEFRIMFSDQNWSDKIYLFLQNVYNIFPENEFHLLIQQCIKENQHDADIYVDIQKKLPKITPFLSELRFALPALIKQKKVMTKQTLKLLGDCKEIFGYVEIGTVGLYISELKKHLKITTPIYLVNNIPPTYSPVDIIERGQLKKLGKYIPLNDYNPFDPDDIPDNSVDLVTCYIGLHHAPLAKLHAFIKSIYRILRPGGRFIIRDHDVCSEKMRIFVSLIHTIFNLGIGVSWKDNISELRYFTSTDALATCLEDNGFKFSGKKKILQANDPSANILQEYIKIMPDKNVSALSQKSQFENIELKENSHIISHKW
ncbi:FAD-binding protein [Gammaproteobacteria bacterium]|nr:FAD-binding protein [Gammaproteobacteria bacterium]